MALLLAALGVGKKLLSKLVELFSKHPLLAVVIALALFAGWKQHQLTGVREDLAKCETQRKADKATWAANVERAEAAALTAQLQKREAAVAAQNNYEELQADNAGLRDYISSHSVRPGNSSVPAASARQGGAAGVPEEPAAQPTVAVPEAVLTTCDADYAYARAAYDWGQDLIARGLAQ